MRIGEVMCRLYVFKANELTKVECSLVYAQNSLLIQSQGDALGRKHSDGWGIGYFANGRPHLEKNVAAAYSCLHFSSAAESVYAHTVVAHVRLATIGVSSVTNCHPFQWGDWVFAHNGTVQGVDQLRPGMLAEMGPEQASQLLGSTDSELLFHWIIARLQQERLITSDGFSNFDQFTAVFSKALLEIDRLRDHFSKVGQTQCGHDQWPDSVSCAVAKFAVLVEASGSTRL